MTEVLDRPPRVLPSPVAPTRVVPPSRQRRPTAPAIVAVLGMATVAVPFAVMIGLSVTRPWWSWGDLALIELRTHDVGGIHTPLLGSYSRFGWSHPGPLSFWVLAVPYRLLGSTPAGLLAGAALVHAAAIAGCGWLAHRRGGRALAALVLLGLAAMVRGLGTVDLVNFWNPFLPLFALAFLILATWSVIEGDRWLLPVVIAVACFAGQTHLGYLPVAGTLAAVATVAALRTGPPASRRRIGAITALTAAVCLAPVVIEQVTNDPGNLTLLLGGTDRTGIPAIGSRRTLAVVAAHLAPMGVWSAGAGSPQQLPGPTGLLWLAATGAAALAAFGLAVRTGATAAARLVALAAVCAATAVPAVLRTIGDPLPYLYLWIEPVGAVLWLSIGWAVVESTRRRYPLTGRSGPVWSVAVALATAALSWSAITAGPLQLPGEPASEPLVVLAPAAVAATAGTPRVRIDAGTGWCARELAVGLSARLAVAGTDVVVGPDEAHEFGNHRVSDDRVPVLTLVCGPDAGERVRRSTEAPVAHHDLLSDAELADLRALRAGFIDRFTADGRADLVPAVDNQALGTLADVAAGGYPLDPDAVARFAALMHRSRFSGAIFWRPDRVAT